MEKVRYVGKRDPKHVYLCVLHPSGKKRHHHHLPQPQHPSLTGGSLGNPRPDCKWSPTQHAPDSPVTQDASSGKHLWGRKHNFEPRRGCCAAQQSRALIAALSHQKWRTHWKMWSLFFSLFPHASPIACFHFQFQLFVDTARCLRWSDWEDVEGMCCVSVLT